MTAPDDDPMTQPFSDEIAQRLERARTTPAEEIDPERTALMRELWQMCIVDRTVQDSGPAVDLLSTGTDAEALLKVIRKAALDSLIAALTTLDNAGFTPGLVESVFTLGDPDKMDGWPFNY